MSQASSQEWPDECPDVSERYCPEVGKTAHNSFNNPPILRGKKLGKIIGVSWRKKGDPIKYVAGFPDAGIPPKAIKSEQDAFYFIVEKGRGEIFLRKCVDIDAK